MRYERTERFKGDYRRLSDQQAERFREVAVKEFAPAAERHVAEPGRPWPSRLRVKAVQGAAGIWEMTWEWPDGRATFEWIEIDAEPAIRWRRLGTHAIFKEP